MIKRLILLLLAILFAFFILRHFNDGKVLLQLAGEAKWELLMLALLSQGGYFFLYALLYQRTLELFEIHWRLTEIIWLVLGTIFVNLYLPLGPLAGTSIFASRARKGKIPIINIAAAVLVVMMYVFVTLALFLTFSFIVLFLRHAIYDYEIMASLVFLVLVTGMVLLLLIGVIGPGFLRRLLRLAQLLIDKISLASRHRALMPAGWSEIKAAELGEISRMLIRRPRNNFYLFFVALSMHLANIITLSLIFLAFGEFISLPLVAAGYSFMMLFWIVSPTPQGIGIVEVLAPVVFSSLGVSMELATLVILVYRGVSLWLPAVFGFLGINIFTMKPAS